MYENGGVDQAVIEWNEDSATRAVVKRATLGILQ